MFQTRPSYWAWILFCALATSGWTQSVTPGYHPVRPFKDVADQRFWLENMVWHHRYGVDEIATATGLPTAEIQPMLDRFGIHPEGRPPRAKEAPLLVLPYPGGRHPRIGFLNGAINPQRETKVSVFTPWDQYSYVVVDIPEAIHSNLGLLYLAHEHVPTVWSRQGVTLEPLEWERRQGTSLRLQRRLPNGVCFEVIVTPKPEGVRFALTLTNGSTVWLRDLRVQVCVMLRGARGFEQQTNANKVFWGPYAACRSAAGDRWVITAWEPLARGWGNPPCPCLHSDPLIPDCAPGETKGTQGWLWFYQGADILAELRRREGAHWRSRPNS